MAVLLFLSAVLPCLAEGERISLAGTWQLATDSAHYRYTISLPGSTDEAVLGKALRTVPRDRYWLSPNPPNCKIITL